MKNNPVFKIGNRLIGKDHPPVVIAEIGINHGGDLKVAFEMVDAAKEAGAEIVKHQTHVIEDEMSEEAKKVIPGNTDISIYEVMANCALNEQDELLFKKYVEEKGMIFLSTPFSRAAADRLEKFDVLAYKIGSGECNNLPLIKHIAQFGKPVILSTGMNDIESVRSSVQILEEHKVSYALMHCTNIYPTPPELVRLGAIQEMEEAFPEAVIGLSDHTLNNNACLAAAALGCSLLERHFTDTKERTGPDIECSMDKKELKELIDGSREIFMMRGGSKSPLPQEQVTIDFAFATVVSIQPILEGEMFTEKNIWVKRPGIGEIFAKEYEGILGKKASRKIDIGTHIKWGDIE